MAELSMAPEARSDWLRGIAKRLPEVLPGFRVVADDWLAEHSRIDLLGVAEGAAVVVDFAEPGRSLETLARTLAHIQWAKPRLGDWRKLAPDVGFSAGAQVRGVLVGPELEAEALAAIAALPEDAVLPVRAHWVGGDVWLETPTGREPEPRIAAVRAPQVEPAASGPSPFRTGLTDADLGLSPAERADLE